MSSYFETSWKMQKFFFSKFHLNHPVASWQLGFVSRFVFLDRVQGHIQKQESGATALSTSAVSTSLDLMIDKVASAQTFDYSVSSPHSSLNILPELGSLGPGRDGDGNSNDIASQMKRRKMNTAKSRRYYGDTMMIGYRYIWNGVFVSGYCNEM